MASGVASAAILAHQGGWDEVLLVLTPVALFAALLWLANTRATRIQDQRTAEAGPSDDEPTGDATPEDGTADDAGDAGPEADPGT